MSEGVEEEGSNKNKRGKKSRADNNEINKVYFFARLSGYGIPYTHVYFH